MVASYPARFDRCHCDPAPFASTDYTYINFGVSARPEHDERCRVSYINEKVSKGAGDVSDCARRLGNATRVDSDKIKGRLGVKAREEYADA